MADFKEQLPVRSKGDYDASNNKRPSSQGTILHDRKNTAEVPAEADQNKRPTAVVYDNGADETVVAADVAIRDGDGVPFSKDNPLPVSSDGNLLEGIDYDYYTRVLSGADNEIETWTYRNGGSVGAVVAVVVATYTDSYRDDLITVDRTT